MRETHSRWCRDLDEEDKGEHVTKAGITRAQMAREQKDNNKSLSLSFVSAPV